MRNRGYTLIECILAACIVLVGFYAVARISPMSYRGAALSKDHLTAIRVARNTIEAVRARPFGAAVADLKGTVKMDGETVEGNPVSQPFEVTSVTTNIPAPTAGFGTVSVTVAWTEGTGTGSAGEKKTLTLTGGINREP